MAITRVHHGCRDFMDDQVHTAQKWNPNYKINQHQQHEFRQLDRNSILNTLKLPLSRDNECVLLFLRYEAGMI